MSKRSLQQARSLLVNECFDEVAQIEFVKNKWITANAWLDLIKKTIPNCGINDISLVLFTRLLLSSRRFSENFNFATEYGFYSHSKRMRLDGLTTQQRVTCFLVTDSGKLPPVTSKD